MLGTLVRPSSLTSSMKTFPSNLATSSHLQPSSHPTGADWYGRGGIDFDKLAEARKLVGLSGDGERWPEEFNDPGFSRQVLGLEGPVDCD